MICAEIEPGECIIKHLDIQAIEQPTQPAFSFMSCRLNSLSLAAFAKAPSTKTAVTSVRWDASIESNTSHNHNDVTDICVSRKFCSFYHPSELW